MATPNKSQHNANHGNDNFVILAVTAVQDARYGYSASAAPWASLRVAKGFGKDKDGEYHPSIFFNAKIFGEPGTDFVDTLADAMQVAKGDRLVIRGAFGVPETWTDKSGNERTDLVIKLKAKEGIKIVGAGTSTPAQQPAPELEEVP